MRAIRLHAFGPAENLTPEQVDDPPPAPARSASPSPQPAYTSSTPPCARA